MQNPSKQGLKHKIGYTGDKKEMVAMQNPSKQGLKLILASNGLLSSLGRNAKSIKTRIETG